MKFVFLTAWIAKLTSRFRRNTNVYRPERHYMRGPGPKAQRRDTSQVSASGKSHIKA